jgi:lipopolysaccharide/colanic/teichoic acid biosynthesis glycosyltransferase
MRYQSPIGNPLSQYWEEELVLTGVSRYWKDSLAGFKYFLAEHLFANFILIVSVILKAISPKPVVMSAVRFYRTYGFTWTVKRLLDIIGAAFGIILTIPVFIIIPIVIKLDSPGPVFFSQERIGKNRRRNDRRSMNMATTTERRNNDRRQNPGYGMPFVIYKFRTMRQDAEKLTGPVWARKKDPRITRIGAILRATRIDEIPQLFNVLKGEMSLVGPRPERAFFIGKLRESISDYEKRLLVRPGLTGLAQVEHKYDESEADTVIKVKYDINYIRNLNIVNDFKIMLKTIYVVFAAKGM